MIRNLFRSNDRKLIGIYVLTSLLLYGSFWLSYYTLNDELSMWLAGALALYGLIILLIRNGANSEIDKLKKRGEKEPPDTPAAKRPRFPFIPLITISLLNIAIGFSISAFFLHIKIVPSMFFGLVLLVMLLYKILQLLIGEAFLRRGKNRFYKFWQTIFILLEVAGCIVVGVYAYYNGPIMWQIFFAFLLCVIYSFGQIYMQKKNKTKQFWDTAAVSYLIGFLVIFVFVLIAMSSGDGGFDIPFAGGSADSNTSNVKKKEDNE